uniref:Uncharacterized protein n=1 Tax=Noccaea caerulescens TaxID=107243 RepID=A0A1J3E0A6_NOCCA
MYMLAYFSDQIVKDACMLTPRPSRLLTHFVVIDMFEREGFSDFSRLPRQISCSNESQTNTAGSFEIHTSGKDGVVESSKVPAETGAVDASTFDESMSTHQESQHASEPACGRQNIAASLSCLVPTSRNHNFLVQCTT